MPTYARLVRASVLSAREHLYVEAARALGGRDRFILARYILPNVVAPLDRHGHARPRHRHPVRRRPQLSRARQPAAGSRSGAACCSEGRDYLREAWWISTFPGLGIMLTVLGMNLLGDGLRDVLDPRLNASR